METLVTRVFARFLERSDSDTGPTSSLSLSRLLLLVAAVAQIAAAWHFRTLTWDDSAITLGFSHTFATTGRIEPTPGSGIVEGYSTTLWMLLMAAAAKILPTTSMLLNFAKAATLLLNLGNLYLIRRWIQSWATEELANLVSGVIGCTLMFAETINGMETPLLLALLLLMLVLEDSFALYLALGAAVTLVRFESLWLLVPFVFIQDSRRRSAICAAAWFGTFAATEIWRIWYFGSALPNTIIAKRWPPYSGSTPHEEFLRHLHEPMQILRFALPWALIAALPLVLTFRRRDLTLQWGKLERPIRASILLSLFSFVLATAIGKNWGPPMRSFYVAWPFAMVLALLPFEYAHKSIVRRISVLATCLLAFWTMGRRVQEMRRPGGPPYMPGATVMNVNETALAILRTQAEFPNKRLLYAGPDMGAVLLNASRVKVLDLGLLCDKVLAKNGYKVVRQYVLQQRQPDLIEVHEPWTSITAIGTYSEFVQDYFPLWVDGHRFFIRRIDLEQIDSTYLRRYNSQQAQNGATNPDVSIEAQFGGHAELIEHRNLIAVH